LLKIQHYAECCQNAVNFLVA